MAEEEEGGGGEAGGSVLKKWGPLAAIVLLVQLVIALGVAHFFGGGLFNNKEVEEGDYVETQRVVDDSTENEDDEMLPFYFRPPLLNNIAANPAGTNGERFVVFDVELGLKGKNGEGERLPDTTYEKENKDFLDKMDKYMPRIKSIITGVMRSKTVDQLEGEFFKDVKEEMKRQLNREVFEKIFKKDDEVGLIRVEDVNVSRLVIQ